MDKPKISIAGCGYVGLVTASVLASRGFNVIATTIIEDHIDLINSGQAPFYEEGLDDVLKQVIKENKLMVTSDNQMAVLNTDITFISVGTPMREDNSIDLSFINTVSKEIGKALAKKKDFHLVVNRSTVVPGTTRNLIGKNLIQKSSKQLGKAIGLGMQPEFLREGSSVYDTFHPNRLIIGEFDKKSGDTLENMWRLFYEDRFPPIERMNIESAELVKYANNSFLCTKISFANEFANFAELIPNVDVNDVMKGIGLDERINPKFFRAGVGFGGSCFHKDLSAIKKWARNLGFNSKVLQAVLDLNENQAIHIVDVAEELIGNLINKKISILGLSFKPGTDDMREAPSIRVINELRKRNVTDIIGYDPKAKESAEEAIGDKIKYAKSIEEALKNSECTLLITDWDEFKELTPDDYKKHMKTPNLIDGRRIYDYDKFNKELNFRAMGRINLE
ncbi:MAG: UDP-glucose/GDP-mannose dehydrogenase family protein [Candidatus Lokiarchaeota archaeon]|nr:UDP-glucose/GDP-mannose dehydrogenase family protein [Candidatus Lokiarchaeota archaeon]